MTKKKFHLNKLSEEKFIKLQRKIKEYDKKFDSSDEDFLTGDKLIAIAKAKKAKQIKSK